MNFVWNAGRLSLFQPACAQDNILYTTRTVTTHGSNNTSKQTAGMQMPTMHTQPSRVCDSSPGCNGSGCT